MKKLKLFQADNGVNYLVPFILVTTLFFCGALPTAYLTCSTSISRMPSR